ncbi:MAG TPA: ATP-binding cassette domain-containing protein [Rickettsiales bacterium]|nr:ATP-binding cassette domain-containing protein [Rickettsiales bacterium]
MESLIKVQNITLIRDKKNILNNISLTIKKRDFITIIGPNGAGKSMLLKCLMNFYRPNSGKISVKKNLKIGYVPQKIVISDAMPISVKKFLYLANKISEVEFKKIVKEIVIDDILDKQLHILSGGELQRVLLARALLNNPEILILDEPAQNLDISGQMAFYKILDNVYKNHEVAILMVSHDLHLVMASTKQVICLFHHICCAGEPQVVTKDPEFISLFGSDMAKMMAIYNHTHNHTHTHNHYCVDAKQGEDYDA